MSLAVKKKFVLIQHCFSNYRVPIFKRLVESLDNWDGKILFGLNPSSSSVKTFNSIEELEEAGFPRDKSQLLKNNWICGPLLWQSGVLNNAWNKSINAIIFEGAAYYISTWAAMLLAKIRGKRILLWTHGSKRKVKGLKKLILKCFFSMADGLLLYGEMGKLNCLDIGVPESKIFLVHNSLDYDEQAKVRDSVSQQQIIDKKRELFKYPELPVFIWVGRLTPWRRLDLMVQAASILREQGVKVNLLFVGPGPEENNLKAQAKDLGLAEHCHFYGPCYEESELAPLFMMSRALVSPGPIGLSCIHAMTYGLPVITSDDMPAQGPEVDAILAGQTGDFFQKNNVENLADVMKFWNLRSDAEVTELKKVAQQRIEEFYSPAYQQKIISRALGGAIVCE